MNENTESSESPQQPPQEREDRAPLTARVLLYLRRNPIQVGAFALLLAILSSMLLGVALPRWVRVGVPIGIAAYLSVGRWVRNTVLELLPEKPHIFLIDLDSATTQADSAVYRIPQDDWPQWSVRDGALDRVHPYLVFGRDVDLDAQQVTGTWRGSAPDRELEQTVRAIRQVREQLEADAKAGLEVEQNGWVIVRNGVVDALETVGQVFCSGTLPDEGEGIADAIDDALDQAGLDEHGELADAVGVDDLRDLLDESKTNGVNDASIATLVQETNEVASDSSPNANSVDPNTPQTDD